MCGTVVSYTEPMLMQKVKKICSVGSVLLQDKIQIRKLKHITFLNKFENQGNVSHISPSNKKAASCPWFNFQQMNETYFTEQIRLAEKNNQNIMSPIFQTSQLKQNNKLCV